MPGATLTTARAGQTPDGSTSLRIDDVRWLKDRPLVLFDGVETVEAADALRGQGLWIAASARPALEPGLFYETDLVGCRVETVDGPDAPGTTVGTVARVEGAPGASVLVVERRRARCWCPSPTPSAG